MINNKLLILLFNHGLVMTLNEDEIAFLEEIGRTLGVHAYALGIDDGEIPTLYADNLSYGKKLLVL